jgi:hypothetical protein
VNGKTQTASAIRFAFVRFSFAHYLQGQLRAPDRDKTAAEYAVGVGTHAAQ